ncbi:hypothetical protein A3D80_00220 [Candidatus Roizmanbacteria bacterium RIFCSPHIGHO2_02_FULL_40_13b]|uniref:Putative gluconeogenesis factor n=1 Tax=Candidatus Roizmanbacteria bacterium RIFCSPHIGHO2_01_FULL_39_24 TaxID=1802032 RepID=A0A1F7GKA6_9BACT|nr:MAG: hypothetical protein A2799_00500 [Candidatus Roizmanbacteria bacterium RIFCSPHIGHO2_01_FULL_39_24]OGK28060.1 MAG: hypothetical protein A3D80_00220 [Candidatus Roizmanbacteria bacterium RIFCSPHIGHO2_02_FULL_40_13b]OGK49569.1 MAG: hypothetical protein A3A56_04190 [Candidatus Roizmanbacteria bacterium RIFCSPLOWO2_01_FULL_40_32]OGK56101.1 MAG: hypothetical protein A3H83_03580 [Candidatus Roizmanbacteria bacterium RIFCSPLOWO2_02_FULL_39_8]
MKNVVVIGGGAGAFVVLSGIKDLSINISAIVTMMDSGGSTGRLRDQYDVLPPGDIRQCLVALSKAPDLWTKLFLYRFESGDLRGHNFGNIFLTALEKITKNYSDVADTAAFILQTKGKVIPVTFDKVHLCVEYDDGEIIETEKLIDTAFHKKTRIKKAYLKPRAKPNQNGINAILNADYIIIGPGDLYTSLIPNFVVDDMKQALSKSRATIINIMNLMTKRGQTPKYTATDHITDIERYIGRKINTILINNTPMSQEIISYYKRRQEIPVVDDLTNGRSIIRQDLLDEDLHDKEKSDLAIRSLVRHSSVKIGSAIMEIIG